MKKSRKITANDWGFDLPHRCDCCHSKLQEVFIDGKTRSGLWGILCIRCHALRGSGLGIGRGQMYDLKSGKKID